MDIVQFKSRFPQGPPGLTVGGFGNSKLGFATVMVVDCAGASGALRPMAARAKPQSLRIDRKFLSVVVGPGGAVLRMFGLLVMAVDFMLLVSVVGFF
jgi:hypothetical protein